MISTTIPDNGPGCLSAEDAGKLDTSRAMELSGPAGSLTIHNCRMLHSSMPKRSSIGRPLLLNAYSSADAMPYTPVPTVSRYYQTHRKGTNRLAGHITMIGRVRYHLTGQEAILPSLPLQQEEAM